MHSEWQIHKGKRFLFCKYANLADDELQAEVDYNEATITAQPLDSVLVLLDVTGIAETRKHIGMFIEMIPRTKKHSHKSAVIGIGNRHRQALFDAVMRITRGNMVPFDDVEKAKDWLVEEE